ncbi:hypothetical protein GGR57DRAFT_509651 [Xylariaceae sp. FL1272]|nr:hypothetical protein GGR57DRAFT_509651 [Xylariaceae sp. FL1272]
MPSVDVLIISLLVVVRWTLSSPHTRPRATYSSRANPSPHLHEGCEHRSPAEYLATAYNEFDAFDCFKDVNVEATKLAAIASGFRAACKDGKAYNGRKVTLANGYTSVFPNPTFAGYADCCGKGIQLAHVVIISSTLKGKSWKMHTRKIVKFALRWSDPPEPHKTAVETAFEDGSMATAAFAQDASQEEIKTAFKRLILTIAFISTERTLNMLLQSRPK